MKNIKLAFIKKERAMNNNLYKGRSYPIGTVRTWKDGSKYKKVAVGKWVEIEDRGSIIKEIQGLLRKAISALTRLKLLSKDYERYLNKGDYNKALDEVEQALPEIDRIVTTYMENKTRERKSTGEKKEKGEKKQKAEYEESKEGKELKGKIKEVVKEVSTIKEQLQALKEKYGDKLDDALKARIDSVVNSLGKIEKKYNNAKETKQESKQETKQESKQETKQETKQEDKKEELKEVKETVKEEEKGKSKEKKEKSSFEEKKEIYSNILDHEIDMIKNNLKNKVYNITDTAKAKDQLMDLEINKKWVERRAPNEEILNRVIKGVNKQLGSENIDVDKMMKYYKEFYDDPIKTFTEHYNNYREYYAAIENEVSQYKNKDTEDDLNDFFDKFKEGYINNWDEYLVMDKITTDYFHGYVERYLNKLNRLIRRLTGEELKFNTIGVNSPLSLKNDLYPIGTTRTWKDGNTYKKNANGDWEKV